MLLEPGALLHKGETLNISDIQGCTLEITRSDGTPVYQAQPADSSVTWSPSQPGAYLIRCNRGSESLTRYIGVVESGWAVCQLTVGAFTAEDFDQVVHSAPVPMDYYIGLDQAKESKWKNFERQFGDAIHPHIHANSFGKIAADLTHEDPNWESLTCDQIVMMLQRLQQWWQSQGYKPLDRIATYTPCNQLVKACKMAGIRVLHSLCPEQNWSDGEWAINHWGMPTCPFWAASDDFRKAGPRTAGGVLAITMNHYQVLLPHLTHWGDFVLSPSHTLRWHRSSESGPDPIRFEQFARDTIANASRQWKHPLFFVAGFEFGRTFGTGIMTDHNRKGILKLIGLSRELPLVFATSSDVLAYYDRHVDALPDRAMLQRDTWAGARTMGKPGMVSDSVVIEKANYKAVIREGQNLPFFHYDYLKTWNYPTAATNVPEDFAECDAESLQVHRADGQLIFHAEKPLPRATPAVIWDAHVSALPIPAQMLPTLDDGRTHWLLEFPTGWHGRLEIPFQSIERKELSKPSIWQTRTLGTGERRHTYLHLDLPLLHDVEIPIQLTKQIRVDGPHGPLGNLGPGQITLQVGPHRTWHRFWNAQAEDLIPTDETLRAIDALKVGVDLLASNWQPQLESHLMQLHDATLKHLQCSERDLALEVFCGARHPLGSRSRASAYDIVNARVLGITAHEHGDGVLAYGPGRSFWCHPRGLTFKIQGIPESMRTKKLCVILHSFDVLNLNARYKIRIAGDIRSHWKLPQHPFDSTAWHKLDIHPEWINDRGTLAITLHCDQTAVLYDWWKERGFVAGLHALWVQA